MGGLDFELGIAEENLIEAKRKASEYLQLNAHTTTICWYSNFEQIVARIVRREQPEFSFGAGGSPDWYAEGLRLLGDWIGAEFKHGKLLAQKMACGDLPVTLDGEDNDGLS